MTKPAAIETAARLGAVDLRKGPTDEQVKAWREAADEYRYSMNYLAKCKSDLEAAEERYQDALKGILKVRQDFAKSMHMVDPLGEEGKE